MVLTYASLSAIVADLLAETVNIDTVIWQGETRLVEDLNLDIFSDTASGSPIGETITKPAGYRCPRGDVVMTNGIAVTTLEWRAYGFIKRYWPLASNSGTPKYIGHKNATSFIVAPTPIGWNYSFEYGTLPEAMSETTPETFLSRTIPTALLNATLVASHKYLKNDERVVSAQQDYAGSLAHAKELLNTAVGTYTSPMQTAVAKPAPKE